jgi:hypothetical protein
MESLEVLGRVEASKQLGVEALQPGDIKLSGEVRRRKAPGVEGSSDGG